MFSEFLSGLAVASSPGNLIAIVAGVAWGVIGGAIPGINGSIAMAMLLPLTYGIVSFSFFSTGNVAKHLKMT